MDENKNACPYFMTEYEGHIAVLSGAAPPLRRRSVAHCSQGSGKAKNNKVIIILFFVSAGLVVQEGGVDCAH